MAQIIACCAQKGGCAKTVTVHNLSTAFKRMGKSVLAVDFDTQASLTTCFGLNPDHVPVNIADLNILCLRHQRCGCISDVSFFFRNGRSVQWLLFECRKPKGFPL